MVFRLFQRKKKNCEETEALNEVIDACKWAENELEEMWYEFFSLPRFYFSFLRQIWYF